MGNIFPDAKRGPRKSPRSECFGLELFNCGIVGGVFEPEDPCGLFHVAVPDKRSFSKSAPATSPNVGFENPGSGQPRRCGREMSRRLVRRRSVRPEVMETCLVNRTGKLSITGSSFVRQSGYHANMFRSSAFFGEIRCRQLFSRREQSFQLIDFPDRRTTYHKDRSREFITMGLLVDGVWKDVWYETKTTGGRFVRKDASFRNWITAGRVRRTER